MITSSLHHQMMYPWEVEHELLAWSNEPLSSHYKGITPEEQAKIPVIRGKICEPEVVWFPKIRTLAVQGHPEMMDAKCQFNLYLHDLLNAYITTT